MLSEKAKKAIRNALADKEAAENLINAIQLEEVTPIEDTATATAEEIAEKVNEIIAAMAE